MTVQLHEFHNSKVFSVKFGSPVYQRLFDKSINTPIKCSLLAIAFVILSYNCNKAWSVECPFFKPY